MNEELLARMADALEGIGGALSQISGTLCKLEDELGGCVTVSGEGIQHLNITGDIDTRAF